MPKKMEWGNPYTHEEYSRTSYCKDELFKDQTCEWCGHRNSYNGLFAYNGSEELFCSKECYRIYQM